MNKLDRERASFARTLDQLKAVFGKRIAPIQVPIGEEAELTGIVRVVSQRAYAYENGATSGVQVDLPDSVEKLVEETHTSLVEAVVETDDELLEAYFEGEEPSREKMVEVIHQGMLAGDIYPVLVGSASTLTGLDMLAEFIIDFGPNPLEAAIPPLVNGELSADPNGPTVAYAFKTTGDQYVGRINLFRVFSGSVEADSDLVSSGGAKIKLSNLFTPQGAEHADAKTVAFGDIAAVAKVDDLRTGQTIRTAGSDVEIAPVAMPRPVFEVTVNPKSNQDEDKLSTAMARAQEEDPTLVVERRAETKETVMSGLGETHVDVTLSRIARKFGVEVSTGIPTIPYRETIQGRADVEGKHKKQSGGRGQFGVAFVQFEPNARGEGYLFVDAIKGGSIPRNLIPAVDKGIKEALDRGILAGFPVIDVKATVYDGKFHSVDSDEMSFKMAGIMAVREAAGALNATILEPIMKVSVRVPEDYMGDIIGDINSKRGRVLGMDSEGGGRVVNAEVPLAEMQRYSVDLRSMTGGRGTFTMEYSHYEPAPPQEVQKVVAAAKVSDE